MALNVVAKAWIKALRSGKYKQITGRLAKDGGFCCLGVLCEQAVKAEVIKEYDLNMGRLPKKVQKWAGLSSTMGDYNITNTGDDTDLTVDNDVHKLSFKDIADIIVEQPEGLFNTKRKVKAKK